MKYFKILPLLVAGALGACYEDKGSYDYTAIPEVQLENAIEDASIMRGQHLTRTPDLKTLLKETDRSTADATFNPDDYTYRWTAYRRTKGEMPPVELATTQDLDTNIYLPIHPEPYRVVYSVTSKATNVSREFMFNITITAGRFASAWLYLTEEDDGTVDLMVRGTENQTNETVLEDGVLERSGFPYRGGGAKFVYYYTANGITPRIIVGTGEATGYIDKDNFEWNDTRMARFMMALPAAENYTFDKIVWLADAAPIHWLDSYGNIRPMGASAGIIYPFYNVLPPGMTGAGYDTVRMAPFVAGSSNFSVGQLVYDTKNKKMMTYKGSASALTMSPDILPPANQLQNHEIYHMQFYASSRSSVVAKNLSDGKYYRYIYSGAVLQTGAEEITNGHLLDQARYFECDQPNGFFYTIIDNKLYAFRTNMNGTGTLREVRVTNRSNVTFDEVTYMGRYWAITSTRPYVMLATYAGSKGSGKLYYLLPDPTEPLDVTIENEITGLNRVKDVSRF
jgi:hypothetical protein